MTATSINMSRIGTSRGPVEFAVAGTGPPILYFHGTPCSSRLVIQLEQQLIDDGFHHPERTVALTLQCAQVHRWDDRRWAPILHPWLCGCFRHAVPPWLFCRFFPILFRLGFPSTEHYLRDLTGTRFSEVQAEPTTWQFAEGVYLALSEFRLERAGYYNDVSSWVREDVLSTGSIDCPTLLLYDPQDPGVPFCHAEYAATKIPTAKTVSLDAGGHLIWFGHDADLMRRRRTEFLRENLAVA